MLTNARSIRTMKQKITAFADNHRYTTIRDNYRRRSMMTTEDSVWYGLILGSMDNTIDISDSLDSVLLENAYFMFVLFGVERTYAIHLSVS